MTVAKNLGIWMDHSSAHLMELTDGPIETKIIASKITYEEKILTADKSEKEIHHKEQDKLSAYYKELGKVIKNYDAILLFGPTGARVELLNLLKADHHFDKIKIDTLPADKMTENQQHAFVKNYFETVNRIPANSTPHQKINAKN